jgi:hypothetical protein
MDQPRPVEGLVRGDHLAAVPRVLDVGAVLVRAAAVGVEAGGLEVGFQGARYGEDVWWGRPVVDDGAVGVDALAVALAGQLGDLG